MATATTHSQSSGAGAVLFTSLATFGYTIPVEYVLTEEEERHLYDLEVQLRLGCDDCASPLLDILCDIPCTAILRRKGLLEAMLDLLGGISFSSASELESEAEGQFQSVRSLSPHFALLWCRNLILGLKTSFAQHLEGALYSITPPLKPGRSITTSSVTQSMNSLRYPSLRVVDSDAELRDLSAGQVSIPGFAFACCTAALPIFMRSKKAGMLFAVVDLIKVCLPLLREPSAALLVGESAALEDEESARFQHLLNRVEQVLSFFGGIPEVSISFGGFCKSEVQSGECAYHLAMTAVVSDLLKLVPTDSLKVGDASSLQLGSLTIQLLTNLCLNEISLGASDFDKILSATCPTAAASIFKARSLLEAATAFVNLMSDFDYEKLRHSISTASIATELLELTPEEGVVGARELGLRVVEGVVFLLAKAVSIGADDAAEESLTIIYRLLVCRNREYATTTLRYVAGLVNSVSCVPHDTFPACLVNVDLAQKDFVKRLANPTIFELLLALFIYPNTDGTKSPEASIALDLLASLSESMLNGGELETSSSEYWAPLYPRLRHLLSLPVLDSVQATTHSILAFTKRLEDACMHSMSSIVIVLKSWVAGLFALLEQERHACALRLRHALGCSSPPSRSTTTSGDPFPPQSALRLISLAKASSVKRSPPTSSSGFTHEDVRKLEGVAFGKYEGSIRVIALRQLTLRLSDANILSTAEEDWVLRLARACLNTIDTVDWEAVNPFQTTDVELCVESANLLQTLVEEDKRLRLKLTLQRGPSPSDCHWLIPINTLLVPLLRDGAHVESPRVATKCVELDLILSIMAKTLFAWAVSYDNWELSIGNLPLLVRRKYSFPGGDSNCSSESAKYISCLETSFGVPTLSPGHLARDCPQWAHLFRRSPLLVHRTLESRVLDEQVADKLEFVLKNAGLQGDLPSGNRWNAISELVMHDVCTARGHYQLREALLCCRLMLLCVPSSATYLATHTTESVSRLLQTAPNNSRDLITLSCALPVLSALLRSPNATFPAAAFEKIGVAVSDVFASVLKPHLERNSRGKSTVGIDDAQLAILELLRSLCKISVLETRTFLKGLSVAGIIQDIVRILCTESKSTYLRVSAGSTVECLSRYSDTWSWIESPSSPAAKDVSAGEPSSPIDAIVRTVTLLRAPSSSKNVSVVVACLGILIAGGRAAVWACSRKKDLNALLRLSMDRRSLLRYLSLQLLNLILTSNGPRGKCVFAEEDKVSAIGVARVVMEDSTECPLVRLACVRMLKLGQTLTSGDISSILNSCVEIINSLKTIPGSCIPLPLDVVLGFLQGEFRAEAFEILRGLKIVPSLVSILQEEFSTLQREGVLRRSQISGSYHYGGHKSIYITSSAWREVYTASKESHARHIVDCKSAAVRLLHAMTIIDTEQLIARHLFCSGTVTNAALFFTHLAEATDLSTHLTCVAMSSSADFLSYMFSYESIDATVSLPSAQLTTCSASLLGAIVKFLSSTAKLLAYKHLVSCLRLLTVLIENSSCRLGLHLGDSIGCNAWGVDAKECFQVLVLLRHQYGASKEYETPYSQLLIYRLEMALSMFLKYSWSARICLLSDSESHEHEFLEAMLGQVESGIQSFHQMSTPSLSLLKSKASALSSGKPSKLAIKSKEVSPTSVSKLPYESKWRSNTRSYDICEQKGFFAGRESDYNLSTATSLRLQSSLMVLQLALMNCDALKQRTRELGLLEALGFILRVSGNWGSAARAATEKRRMFLDTMVPTHLQLLLAALGCLSAFLDESTDFRMLSGLSATTVVAQSFSNTSGSVGASISQLLTAGLSKEMNINVRCLCLNLAASGIKSSGLPSSKGSLTQMLVEQTLQCLQGSSFISLTLLLDNLFSYYEAAEPSSANGSPAGGLLMPFPQLLKWIVEKDCFDDCVVYTVIRCIGRMSHKKSSKRVRLLAICPESINFIVISILSTKSLIVFCAAVTSLWSIVHTSEQSIAVIKSHSLFDGLERVLQDSPVRRLRENHLEKHQNNLLDSAVENLFFYLHQT